MSKIKKNTVQISKLKPHLSRYLRAAQKGFCTTVLDRETPIAVIGPVDPSVRGDDGLDLIPASERHENFSKIAVSPVRGKIDSLALLLEERGDR